MAGATERIPVLVTPDEKSRIADMARAAGLSMGEFLRRAADSFRPDEDQAVLDGMLEQVARSTAQAGAALDEALTWVEASNRRIAAIEAKQKAA